MDEWGHTAWAPGAVVAVGGCVGSSASDRLGKVGKVWVPRPGRGEGVRPGSMHKCLWALSE